MLAKAVLSQSLGFVIDELLLQGGPVLETEKIGLVFSRW